MSLWKGTGDYKIRQSATLVKVGLTYPDGRAQDAGVFGLSSLAVHYGMVGVGCGGGSGGGCVEVGVGVGMVVEVEVDVGWGRQLVCLSHLRAL